MRQAAFFSLTFTPFSTFLLQQVGCLLIKISGPYKHINMKSCVRGKTQSSLVLHLAQLFSCEKIHKVCLFQTFALTLQSD